MISDMIINKLCSCIRRKINALTVYKYPECADGWVKYPNPVIGSDEGVNFDPHTIYYKGKFIMYVSNRDMGTIVRYESDDGLDWKNKIVVLHGNSQSDWEKEVNRATVIMNRKKWTMLYTGQIKGRSCIGIAESKDGINFQKKQEKPIISPEFEFERNSVMNPCLLYDEEDNIFKVWYSAGDQYEPDVICYAESKDCVIWEKYLTPVLTKGMSCYDKYKVGGCDVKKINGRYVMYYIGYQNLDNARICIAYSNDGLIWRKSNQNPILSPTKGGWDAHAVYKPSVISMDNKEMLWYNGRNECIENIGFAYRLNMENIGEYNG